ncbi:MAG: HEAT repeat domain-containing protein, partial [Armatimonadota bacterium]
MKNLTILGLLLIAAVCISAPVAGASAVAGLTPFGVPNMTKLSDAAVCKALKSNNALEREAAAQEIGTRKALTCEADVRLLLTDLQPTVRLAASDTLLQLGDKSGIPVLQELLVGSSPSTALRAAGVLARAGDGAEVALAQSKLSSDNPITRWKALMALKMAADKNVALAALSIGRNDKTERVRVPAITYLG